MTTCCRRSRMLPNATTLAVFLVATQWVGRPQAQVPSSAPTDQDAVVEKIERVLEIQATAWNAGDIERFMQTYWNSDNLTFCSGGKLKRGWQTTRDNYRRRYPDRAAMGHLHFDQLEVQMLGSDAALVLGRWHLRRDEDPLEGNFSLVLRQFDEGWKIIHDHTSLATTDQ